MIASRFLVLAISFGRHVIATARNMQRLPAAGFQPTNQQLAASNVVAGNASSYNLALRSEESFYMGQDPSNPLVQLTALANSSDTRLLSTERFADAIGHMTCSNDHVQMQFVTSASFQAAQSAWKWIVQGPPRLIILVLGDHGCATSPNIEPSEGDQDETYAITSISFDTKTLTATLTGSTGSLGRLLDGHWKLRGSSAGIMKNNLQPRLFSNSGDIDIKQQATINNLLNQKVAGPVNASLDADLSSQGSVHWEVEVDLDITASTLTIATTGVSFTLTPHLSLSGAIDAINPAEVHIPDIPLGTGLKGPLGSEVGLFLRVGAQASLAQVKAAIDVSIDIELALSDGQVVVNGQPSVTGFHPSFSVHSPEISGEVDLVSSVGPTIALVMQASLDKVGAEAGIQLEAPKAQMTLAAKADSAGVCNTDHSVGVGINVEVGAALSAIWNYGQLSDPNSSLKIYATSTPVFSTCTAFGPTVNTGSPTPSLTPLTTLSPTASPTTNPGPGVWSRLCQAIEANKNTTGICPTDTAANPSTQAGINPINGLPAPTMSSAI